MSKRPTFYETKYLKHMGKKVDEKVSLVFSPTRGWEFHIRDHEFYSFSAALAYLHHVSIELVDSRIWKGREPGIDYYGTILAGEL